MHCNLFKIYCAPLNLGITRTGICRLNFFAQRPIFSGLKFFNKPEISYSGPPLKVPPGGPVLRIFTSLKNLSTSAGFEPANLGSRGEHVTLRSLRQTSSGRIEQIYEFQNIWRKWIRNLIKCKGKITISRFMIWKLSKSS